ncbi:hypothetical protein [Clostridium beijerinckii]|uniref:DUF11 domain-containing protein n=1 Tax=Clostridium beijerinckii TaxID=1520 RepID=A0AAX0BA52_CLOBE|nr:hypothetical protein [Clostridium beijerinckii]MBA8933405.1 hypothetical protein [Clostridium beijerinckii]NRT36650.1 hypothetical protein [Clostridium beijerinckii]NRT43918.1 hypothetical protein [Clostridium beijerinckii]NRT91827.1 hypothetical protein [Clostridium beijerinckii]NRU37606.1 hypothetical protein [Clostridium beijerinckii]
MSIQTKEIEVTNAETQSQAEISDGKIVDSLFQNSIQISKTGPVYSRVGDIITYTYVITNTSPLSSPNLVIKGIVDIINNVATDITKEAINAGALILPSGASVTFQSSHLVSGSDPNPLVSTVVAVYNPFGYSNEISDYDVNIVTIVNPNFTVEKICETGKIVAGGIATFRINITNKGNAPLNVAALDQGMVYTSDGLAPGATFTFTVQMLIPIGQCGTGVTNYVFVVAALPEIYGINDLYFGVAGATCSNLNLGGARTFWTSSEGHAILDTNGDGRVDNPVTIGSGIRKILVKRIILSDTILLGNYCTNVLDNSCGNNLGNNLPAKILGRLMAETLALNYNIEIIPFYSGQLVSAFGCSNLLQQVGLAINSTVNDVLALANILIGDTGACGSATQGRVNSIINLISCLNGERF